MQVVIEIPDNVYEMVMNTGTYGCYRFNSTKAIKKGIPLTKEDTVPFDFELYQAGLMDMPKEMIEVLDKIRAEIIQVANEEKVNDERWALGLRYAAKIIDKYKPESEDNEVIK